MSEEQTTEEPTLSTIAGYWIDQSAAAAKKAVDLLVHLPSNPQGTEEPDPVCTDGVELTNVYGFDGRAYEVGVFVRRKEDTTEPDTNIEDLY